jgi:hypothetical protein
MREPALGSICGEERSGLILWLSFTASAARTVAPDVLMYERPGGLESALVVRKPLLMPRREDKAEQFGLS